MKKSAIILQSSTLKFATISLLILLLFSCKRDNLFIVEPQKLTIKETKEWFEQNYLKPKNSVYTGSIAQSNENIQALLQSPTEKLTPFLQWNSYLEFLVSNRSYLVVPIKNEKIEFANEIKGMRAVVFYLSPSGKINFDIVELFAKSTISSTQLLNQIQNLYGKQNLNTQTNTEEDSYIIVYDKNYKYNKSFTNKSGVLKNSWLRVFKKKSLTHASSSTYELQSSEECEEWYVVFTIKDGSGNVVYQEILYSYYTGNCGDGINNPNDQDAPGDYGGGDPTEYITYQENNNLTDPCLQAAKAAITNSTLTNYIYISFTVLAILHLVTLI